MRKSHFMGKIRKKIHDKRNFPLQIIHFHVFFTYFTLIFVQNVKCGAIKNLVDVSLSLNGSKYVWGSKMKQMKIVFKFLNHYFYCLLANVECFLLFTSYESYLFVYAFVYILSFIDFWRNFYVNRSIFSYFQPIKVIFY